MIRYEENALTAQGLNTLRNSVGWRLFSGRQAELAVRNTLYSIVALEGDRPVAMGRVVGDGAAYLYLVDVAVVPEFQGRGMGGEVVRRALAGIRDFLVRENLDRIALNIVSAPGKEDFYRRLGFADIQAEGTGTGMQQILKSE